ncbi:restriction endonuclease fold toxin-2 domain-containing protein [Streptomyces sp. NPDC001070]
MALRDGGYSGGLPGDKAYQYRVAGYPEKEVLLPASISESGALMVDGLGRTDGLAIEAKHVRNQRSCARTLDGIRQAHLPGKKDFLYAGDREELAKYAATMSDPRNKEMRGVEIDTDYQDSVPYWRAMMAAYGVKGYARYVP